MSNTGVNFYAAGLGALAYAPRRKGPLFTAWRYEHLLASVDDVMSEGFMVAANSGPNITIQALDTIELECKEGWFKVRVYELDALTKAPKLQKLTPVYGHPDLILDEVAKLQKEPEALQDLPKVPEPEPEEVEETPVETEVKPVAFPEFEQQPEAVSETPVLVMPTKAKPKPKAKGTRTKKEA